MTRYSITRMPPSELSEFSDVHGIDYMNVVMHVPEHIMNEADNIDIQVCRSTNMLELVVATQEMMIFNYPIEHNDKGFYPTDIYKNYNDESGVYYFNITGYVCHDKLAHKLDGHVIEPSEICGDAENRYDYPTNAKWVSRHGVELDKEVA